MPLRNYKNIIIYSLILASAAIYSGCDKKDYSSNNVEDIKLVPDSVHQHLKKILVSLWLMELN